MRKLFVAIAGTAMATAAVLGGSEARATLFVDYSLNGGGSFLTLASGPSAGVFTATATVGNFVISGMSSLSNSPGTAALAEMLGTTLSITNTDSVAHSIIIAVSDIGFTHPVSPPTLQLDSHVGGSVAISGAGNTLSASSCLFAGNVNADTCVGALFTAGPGTPNITANSFNDDQFAAVTLLPGTYSMVELWNLTLSAGSQLNFSTSTTLQPVPEPITLALLGTGLLGVGLVRRRRRNS